MRHRQNLLQLPSINLRGYRFWGGPQSFHGVCAYTWKFLLGGGNPIVLQFLNVSAIFDPSILNWLTLILTLAHTSCMYSDGTVHIKAFLNSTTNGPCTTFLLPTVFSEQATCVGWWQIHSFLLASKLRWIITPQHFRQQIIRVRIFFKRRYENHSNLEKPMNLQSR